MCCKFLRILIRIFVKGNIVLRVCDIHAPILLVFELALAYVSWVGFLLLRYEYLIKRVEILQDLGFCFAHFYAKMIVESLYCLLCCSWQLTPLIVVFNLGLLFYCSWVASSIDTLDLIARWFIKTEVINKVASNNLCLDLLADNIGLAKVEHCFIRWR